MHTDTHSPNKINIKFNAVSGFFAYCASSWTEKKFIVAIQRRGNVYYFYYWALSLCVICVVAILTNTSVFFPSVVVASVLLCLFLVFICHFEMVSSYIKISASLRLDAMDRVYVLNTLLSRLLCLFLMNVCVSIFRLFCVHSFLLRLFG